MQLVKKFPVVTFVEPLSAFLQAQKLFAEFLQATRVRYHVMTAKQAASGTLGPIE